MGLTNTSTGHTVLNTELTINKSSPNDKVVAIAGNPNVGKSTIFNALTGLNQHTGNWPGKTVTNAQGEYSYDGNNFILVDIPGTYSLMASSVEEEVARDFVCFGFPDATIVVADATCLERNLNLILQVLEITPNVIVCVNLLDEARKKKINIDLNELSLRLGVPVVGTSARSGEGLEDLMHEVKEVSFGKKQTSPIKIKYNDIIEECISILEPVLKEYVGDKIDTRWLSLKLIDIDESMTNSLNTHLGYNILEDSNIKIALKEVKYILEINNIKSETLRDNIVETIVSQSEQIYKDCVNIECECYNKRDRKLDKILTSRATGIPIMLLMLAAIFWITIEGANYPSEIISNVLFSVQDYLTFLFNKMNAPEWIHGILVLGIYRTLAWVVSVMLPPMAIFFPLFTLLEDSGYLPRVAFNMDKFFKKANAHGKQSLTMWVVNKCMPISNFKYYRHLIH